MFNIALVADVFLAEKFIEILENHTFSKKIQSLSFVPLNSSEEEKVLRFQKKDLKEENINTLNWKNFDLVFFAGDVTKAQYLANAAEAGCKVIDMHGICANLIHVPLIVPTVNDHLFTTFPSCNVISLPNPEATQAALILASLLAHHPIDTLFVTSLASAANNGLNGVNQLASQTARLLNGLPLAEEETRVAFDMRLQNGQNIVDQLERLFPNLKVICHRVNVPVFYGLSQCLNFSPAPIIEKNFWENHPFITVSEKMPTPVSVVTEEADKIELYLKDNLWCIADELRMLVCTMSIVLANIFSEK